MIALVTTAPSGDFAEAQDLARRFGVTAEERAGRLLPELLAAAQGAPVLVLGSRRADLYEGDRSHRASVGIAFLRVVRAQKGEVDPLVRAAGLRGGDRVLDCTLGLGGDALVAAHAVGPQGAVMGLEADPVLAAFTAAGLKRLPAEAAEAAARIEVRRADHRAALRALPSQSFDVVLFDPMFRAPLDAGPLFDLLRARAHHAPLERDEVDEGLRVARRGVLVKDAWPGRELYRLGLEPLPSRRAPKIVFGWAAPSR
jgi:hypothetical protein